MGAMDHAKVIAVLEKYTIFHYFEKLADAPMRKLVLFPILPYTAAANLSDPRYFVMLENPSRLASLHSGRYDN